MSHRRTRMSVSLAYCLVLALSTALTACSRTQPDLNATATAIARKIFTTQTASIPSITPSPAFTATPTYTPTPAALPLSQDTAAQFGLLFEMDGGYLRSIAAQPKGDLLAIATNLGIHLYRMSDLSEVRYLQSPSGEVYTMAWSPDGRRLASWYSAGEFMIWNLEDWSQVTLIWDIPSKEYETRSIAWSPDGSRLAVSDSSYKIANIFDAVTGSKVGEIHAEDYYHDLRWSPAGDRLLSVNTDDTLHVWDAVTGEDLYHQEASPDYLWNLAYSPDGRWLAGSTSEGLRVFDADSWAEVANLSDWNSTQAPVWSPDGSKLAMVTPRGEILVWDTSTWQIDPTFKSEEIEFLTVVYSGSSVVWSGDGRFLAAICGYDSLESCDLQRVVIWEAQSGHLIGGVGKGIFDEINSLVWTPDGRQLLAGGNWSHLLGWWDPSTQELQRMAMINTGKGSPNGLDFLRFSPDGRRLAWDGASRKVFVWDAEANQQLAEFPEEIFAFEGDMTWSPDGQKLAFTAHLPEDEGSAKWVVIWTVDGSAEPVYLKPQSGASIYHLAWSPDGSLLAAGTGEDEVIAWETANWQPERLIEKLEHRIDSLTWLPNGDGLNPRLAVVTVGGEVVFYDQKAEARIGGYQLESEFGIFRTSWSPDGKMLAGMVVGHINLFDGEGGRVLGSALNLCTGADDLVWSPDGSRLASQCFAGILKVWGARTAPLPTGTPTPGIANPTFTPTPTITPRPTITPTPTPYTYAANACMQTTSPAKGDLPAYGFTECVTGVVLREDGNMQINFMWDVNWLAPPPEGYCIRKGPDKGNRNMYLTDDLGNRYDHFEVNEPMPWAQCIHQSPGWFVFPPADPRAKFFVFHDEDNWIQTDPIPRTWP